MAGTTRKWLVGCGLGCGGAIVLSIVGPLLFGLVMMRPMDHAVEAQNALTAAMGDRDSFTPPAGPPAADRLEAFLAVRRAVLPWCERFTKIAADLDHMDELGEKSDRPGRGELFRAITRVGGSVLGMVGDIGQLNQARNEALLSQRMGLGEYIWLYTLVYHSWLGNPAPDIDHAEEDGDAARAERQRATLTGMMRRHADALAQAGNVEASTLWREEADRLERTGDRIPFPGGALPADWGAAFEARGDDLRLTFCEPMAQFELGQVRKKGMSIQAD